MTRCFALVFACAMVVGSSTASAEPPNTSLSEIRMPSAPVVHTSNSPEVLLPMLVQQATDKIHAQLNGVLFENELTGESAALQVTPTLPGCKLGLTYRF